MMITNQIYFFFLCFFIATTSSYLSCHEETKPPLISQMHRLESIKITELVLTNGMTICLKKTDAETDEIFFKLAALGGFASLPSEWLPSGQLADKIAWESGMGGMTSDQVSVFLYENSLEFIPEITPFSRLLEGEGRKESIKTFFECIHMLFTKQQFTKEGLQAAKNSAKSMISKLNHDNDSSYEAVFLGVNTQNFQALKPLNIEDLEKVNFDVAKEFFHRSFFDPSEFFCVITGNFDVDEVIKWIEKYLGSIPKSVRGSELKKTFSVPFPSGITETTIKLANQSGCLTHITFPLQIVVKERNIHEIAFMCQIIEARLRRVITDKMNLSYGVDVSYEFPVYPFLNNPWISIRYRCEKKNLDSLKEIVMVELKGLLEGGVTIEEVESIKKLEKGSQSFWLKDDYYWVSMLTNYYLWGWNPEKIDYDNTLIYDLSVADVNVILKKAISLTNSSTVTAIPQK